MIIGITAENQWFIYIVNLEKMIFIIARYLAPLFKILEIPHCIVILYSFSLTNTHSCIVEQKPSPLVQLHL